MASVLGRPTTIDPRDGWATFPIDAPIPKDRREIAPMPRAESDPPTPLTKLLWGAELTAPLRDILVLEKQGPHPSDFSKIEKMHSQILQITEHCPPFFRMKNPDTRFDNHPDCLWLPESRPVFENGRAFTIMALHRSYIFTNPSSRTAALKAAIDSLRSDRAYFNFLTAKHYKTFSIVLHTFDAIILAAAIYILHPLENGAYLEEMLQNFDWSMQRFQIISEINSMAKTALGVMKAIHIRIKKVLGPANSTSHLPALYADSSSTLSISPQSRSPPSVNVYLSPGPQNSASISSSSNTYSNTQPSTSISPDPGSSSYDEPPPPPTIQTSAPFVPADFDFSSIEPLQPMHDLLFNDLAGAGDDPLLDGYSGVAGEREGEGEPQYDHGQRLGAGVGGLTAAAPQRRQQQGGGYWQFEGDFGIGSFWGFMNTYSP